MLKKILFVIGFLLLAGGLAWVGVSQAVAQSGGTEGPCPPGYVIQTVLDPILLGAQGSKTVELSCRPADEGVKTIVLEPLSPEDMERPEPQATGTSPIVRGPSDSAEYRCVVVLEPLEEGGKASQPVCGSGRIESADGVSLDSLYLIAKFYDDTSYGTLLTEYYGQYSCSAGYSYGQPDLRIDEVDNRFASGQGFSDCDLITVYDLYNYAEPMYTCGPNCPSFYALNDAVSSWEIKD